MPAQSLEIAQHLKTGHAQSTGLHRSDRAAPAVLVADQVARSEHHLGEAGVANGTELGLQRPGQRDGVHTEVADMSLKRDHGLRSAPDEAHRAMGQTRRLMPGRARRARART